MADFSKKIKKLQRIFSDEKTPVIVHTFDDTLSLYARGKDAKPLISLSASGDVKISLITLSVAIITIAALSSATTVIMVNAAKRRQKKAFRKYREDIGELSS